MSDKTVSLGSVATKVRSLDPKRHFSSSEFTYVDIGAVDQTAKQINDPKKIPISDAPSRARQLLRAGDILISTVRPNLNAVAVVPEELDGSIASTGFCVFRPDPAKAHTSYMFHWVKSKTFIADMVRKATGATYPAVSDRIILESTVPLPTLDEQRRIAGILDRVEELRAIRREAMALLDQLPQAIFVEMFGDRMSIFSKWPRFRLGDQLEFLTSGSRGWAKYYSADGDIFLRIQNVRADALDLRDVAYVSTPQTQEAIRTRVKLGDVLLSITADLGRSAVVDDRVVGGYINQHLAILRPRLTMCSRYLSAFLSSVVGQDQIQGKNRQGVKAGLNFEDIKSLQIPIPPIEHQDRFAGKVDAIRHAKTVHQSALTELDALFASLQRRLIRGEDEHKK